MRAWCLVDLLSLWRLRMPTDEHQPHKLVRLLLSVYSSSWSPGPVASLERIPSLATVRWRNRRLTPARSAARVTLPPTRKLPLVDRCR
jgi:hypothetical protein